MKKFAPLALIALTACSTYKPPVLTPAPPKTQVLNKDLEAAWKATIRCFSENNIQIEIMDHSSYFIRTKGYPVQDVVHSLAGTSLVAGDAVKVQNEWCDCGEASLGNVWSTGASVLANFTINLDAKKPDQTEVRIYAFFEGTYLGKRSFTSAGYDVSMPLKCVSKGSLEVALWNYLNTH